MSDPFETILGQEPAVAMLRAAVEAGRIPSAYLFEGPTGVGKSKAALALAIAAIAGPGGDLEAISRRVLNGSHPDVRIFRPRDEGDRNIKVDFVRDEILRYAQFAPFESAHAFLIFPEADVSFPENHPEGANAMLKTLEEPRPGVHFVLLAERPDRLLVTIRSRCQRARFRRLGPDVIATILADRVSDPETRRSVIALADGRADRALQLASEGSLDSLFELAMRIDETAARRAPGAVALLVEELAKRQDLGEVLEALTALYRDLATSALGLPEDRLAFARHVEAVQRRGAEVGAARAARVCELIRKAEERIEQNASPALALEELLLSS